MLAILLALGGALQSPGGAKPTPLNQEQWVLHTDYPADAIKAREAGTVGVRLGVDAAGRVSSCTVTQSAKSAALDAASCKLLVVRARFSPARGNAGKAVASTFEAKFQWVIPSDIDKLGEFLVTVELDAEGRLAKCATEKSGPVADLLDQDLCSIVSDESEFMIKHGRSFRTFRIIFALSLNESEYPLDASRWGTLISRQLGELKVAEDSDKPISCTAKTVSGEDLGMTICDEMDLLASAPPSGKPVHALRIDFLVFGTPR